MSLIGPPCVMASVGNISIEGILTEFTNYAEQTQTDWQVPGMAIAIVQDGKTIYARGFGKRNINSEPVTSNTVFDIASLTKSFTATLLAMQIDYQSGHH